MLGKKNQNQNKILEVKNSIAETMPWVGALADQTWPRKQSVNTEVGSYTFLKLKYTFEKE